MRVIFSFCAISRHAEVLSFERKSGNIALVCFKTGHKEKTNEKKISSFFGIDNSDFGSMW